MSQFLTILTSDIWVMEHAALERLAAMLSDERAIAVAARLEAMPGEQDDSDYEVKDGVAHIQVSGVLMKSVPWIFQALGVDATGYAQVAQAIDAAEGDPAVKSIMMNIDSPGGSAAGIHSMADRIFNTRKPVAAHVDTLGASGAYWMASQADAITASRGAQVGSIGAYTARVDLSRAAENAGVKVHLIASGKYKGAGYPGTAITDEQLADVQKQIDALAAEFVADIARGRGVDATRIQESADGRVFSAADARARGLIDAVTSDPLRDIRMKTAMEQMAALVKESPKHAALIADMAIKDKSEEEIRAEVVKLDKAEKDEADAKAKADADAKIADLAKDRDAKTAEVEALKVKLSAAEKERDALTALKNGTQAAAKIQPDPEQRAAVKKIPQAEFDAMSPRQQAQFFAANGEIAKS